MLLRRDLIAKLILPLASFVAIFELNLFSHRFGRDAISLLLIASIFTFNIVKGKNKILLLLILTLPSLTLIFKYNIFVLSGVGLLVASIAILAKKLYLFPLGAGLLLVANGEIGTLKGILTISVLVLILTYTYLNSEKSTFKKEYLYVVLIPFAFLLVNMVSTWGEKSQFDSKRFLTIGSLLIAIIAIILLSKFDKKIAKVIGLLFVSISMVVTALPSISIYQAKTVQGYSDIEQIKNYTLPGVGYKNYLRGKTFQECDIAGTVGRDCFITLYVDLAKSKGMDFAINDILNAIRTNRGTTLPAVCHQVTHKLGELAGATIFKNRILDGLKMEPQICATGFTHGILTVYWNKYSNKELSSHAATACSELNLGGEYYRWTCNHILGHELVSRDELNPGPQLRACLTIKDKRSSEDCLSGGWMQFFSDDPILAMFVKVKARPSTVFAYCDKEPLISQRMCYQETFPTLSILTGSAFTQMLNLCTLAKDATDKIWCLQGVGRDIAISFNYTTEQTTVECLKTAGEVRDYCLTAAAASITLNTGSTEKTYAMCVLVEDKNIKAYCNRWVRDSRKLIQSGPNTENTPKK